MLTGLANVPLPDFRTPCQLLYVDRIRKITFCCGNKLILSDNKDSNKGFSVNCIIQVFGFDHVKRQIIMALASWSSFCWTNIIIYVGMIYRYIIFGVISETEYWISHMGNSNYLEQCRKQEVLSNLSFITNAANWDTNLYFLNMQVAHWKNRWYGILHKGLWE